MSGQGHPEELARLRELARDGRLTLVDGSREETRNSAQVLKEVLEEDQAPDGDPG
jgi:uncharacterized protein YeaO (DUF488 family)